ncbi:hypothetical protein [Armatimonas sp.]|uniref:hypothetical protein n=1 Tax=Armatimonas sp. TaxID=1872638 RepID=UPI00286D5759|nr:hypothetical protein [Armatimonas sp.]
MSTDKRFTRSERALIAVGILIPSLVLAGVAINARLNDVPPLALPQHAMPVPNAHDTLRVAKTLLVSKLAEAELSPRDDKKEQPLETRKALLMANEKALATVREALTQEYRQPMTYDINQNFPEYAEQRELARMLSFASHTYADLGNYSEAARCATDAIALGVKIARGGPLIGELVGIACEAIGRKALADCKEKLDTPTLKTTLERLDALEQERWPLSETMEVEHLWSQKTIRDLSQRNLSEILPAIGAGDWEGQNRWLALRILFTPKRLAAGNNDRYYTKLIVAVKQPYRKDGVSLPEPTDAINEMLLPVFAQAHFTEAKNRTEMNLLRAQITLRLTGTPDPRFTDPFGQDQPLRYKKDGAKYTLYSVGPDGDDDGGRAGVPREIALAKRERGRTLNADDEGDLVAGINTY